MQEKDTYVIKINDKMIYMKHLFIINPIAGNASSLSLAQFITDVCNKHSLDYQIVITKYANNAIEVTKKLNPNSDVCVYAIGGDGTAFEVLNGLAKQKKIHMAIIPCGTGNDYYRMIGEKSDDLKKLLLDTIQGKDVTVDYGKSNKSLFLNVTSIGMDAKVNEYVCEHLKKKSKMPKKMLYGYSGIYNILRPDPFHAKIVLDHETIENDYTLIAIMNGAYYGNGVAPAKNVSLQDGLFNIVTVDKLGRLGMIGLIKQYYGGDTENKKAIHFYKSKSIQITADEKMTMQSDGETFKDNNITIECIENGLTLRVPQNSKLK